MSEDLPVQGTILSSSQCTVKDASAMLGSFLASDQVPEHGLVRTFLESVSDILEEQAARPQPTRKEKRSRKHIEIDHKRDEDGEEHKIRSGLNGAEAVNAEAENGHKKGSSKKRESRGVDGAENELAEAENGHKKGSSKKRKSRGIDGAENELEAETNHIQRKDFFR